MPAKTGPSLPKSLLEELEGANGAGHGHNGKLRRHLNRKEARKQDRQQRKQRKADYFTSAHSHDRHVAPKRNAEQEHPESPQRKKVKLAQPASIAAASSKPVVERQSKDSASSKTSRKNTTDAERKPKAKAKTALEKLAEGSRSVSAKHKTDAAPVSFDALSRTAQEEEEDAYIAYMEAKLGMGKGGKRKGKPADDEDDGLDELLMDIDNIESSIFLSTRQKRPLEESAGETEDEEDVDEEETELDDSSEAPSLLGDAEGGSDDEWGGIDGSEDDAKDTPSEPQLTPVVAATTSDKPVAGTRYIPPHLRNRANSASSEQESEAQLKLNRQLKGLLNRMSEQNIASIIDDIEEVYRNHRRNDVTSTLTTLIIDGISAHSILLDSYVVLHAALVSSLHKLIGVEFAAHFVQSVVASYERHFVELQQPQPSSDAQPRDDQDPVGKECSNLIILLSELYNFQVISCVLVYDVIRGLLDGDLTEFKVELLLKIARNSGAQLRQDDPTALKSIIQIVHDKLPEQPNALSSRTRFMVETLSNLKNNKIKKNAGQSAGGEAVERMKKFLSGLSKKRHVLAHEPLRVSLEDLHSADSKGKWWLVGAAWGGDPLVEHQDQQREAAEKSSADALSENVLLKLAKKQGMNTDIRRSIFVVLMSSEDYVEACERLSQLKLTEVQQREIIRVVLHCCGNEKAYNPFYTFVGQQLCRTSHSHKITLQFCLWDFLRDLGETNVGGAEIIKNLGDADMSGFNLKNISSTRMRNIARAFGWWIAKDCCTLAILKPVDFTLLKLQSQTFVKELLTQIFVNSQLSSPSLSTDSNDLPQSRNRGPLEDIFLKATRIQALVIGLVYFIGEHFGKARREDSGFLKWASQVAIEILRTGTGVTAGL
ncbi:hypothetical protein OBBRIDRAFT_789292 [Obba rivulosa]|uniref:MI domain-containing protein n=1 Tax=Obba rivulosa TaxID=1052685 RepID=A0A8E2DRL4_9APHY|nr:hypothetical protein OBBRIDRAFT_789292 [Obba rivulosa]